MLNMNSLWLGKGQHAEVALYNHNKFSPQLKVTKMLLSKPKPNHQLNSTEFEVRLHSYIVIHHPPHPHKVNLYTQNWTELTTAQLARRDPLYNCTFKIQNHIVWKKR